MHELGIIFYIIDEVEKTASKNNINRVKSVTLEVGDASNIIEDYFTDCRKWAVERTTHLKGCKLKIVECESKNYCQDCNEIYSAKKYGNKCPKCGSTNSYLVSGRDVVIKEIETFDI